MALNLIKRIAMTRQRLCLKHILTAGISNLYEPDYLETAKPKLPLLPTLNIQIKGYDYPILENYQAWIHKLTNVMLLDIDDGWALPSQDFKIQRFKTGTSTVESEYNLKIYERNIQISDVPAVKYSVLIRTLEASLPQGVTLNVNIFDPELENKRYVPDKELLDLKSELVTLTTKK